MFELLLFVVIIGILSAIFPIAEPYRKLIYAIVVVILIVFLFNLIGGGRMLPAHLY